MVQMAAWSVTQLDDNSIRSYSLSYAILNSWERLLWGNVFKAERKYDVTWNQTLAQYIQNHKTPDTCSTNQKRGCEDHRNVANTVSRFHMEDVWPPLKRFPHLDTMALWNFLICPLFSRSQPRLLHSHRPSLALHGAIDRRRGLRSQSAHYLAPEYSASSDYHPYRASGNFIKQWRFIIGLFLQFRLQLLLLPCEREREREPNRGTHTDINTERIGFETAQVVCVCRMINI